MILHNEILITKKLQVEMIIVIIVEGRRGVTYYVYAKIRSFIFKRN